MSLPFRLVIPRPLYDDLIGQLLTERPNEGCGLLAGPVKEAVGQVEVRYPLPNLAGSPTLYEADPHALLAAHKDMRARDIDILAVYHSHPTSLPVPSATDHRSWFHGPDVVCLIVSLVGEIPAARGWRLHEGEHHEVVVEVV